MVTTDCFEERTRQRGKPGGDERYAVNFVAAVLFWLLMALILAQAALALRFLYIVWHFRRDLLRDNDCPRAAIVLCLRGTDPFLRRCLLYSCV